MMKESAAWRRIAQMVDAMTGEREGFLCCLVNGLYCDDEVIDVFTKGDMLARVGEYLEYATTSAAYKEEWIGGDTPRVNRAARVMAALWLAEEAEAVENEENDDTPHTDEVFV